MDRYHRSKSYSKENTHLHTKHIKTRQSKEDADHILQAQKRYNNCKGRNSSASRKSSTYSRRRSLSVPGSRSSSHTSLSQLSQELDPKEQEELSGKHEPKVWQEFVQYILSINEDIWTFDMKTFGETRNPSEIYKEAIDALPDYKHHSEKKNQYYRHGKKSAKYSSRNEKIQHTEGKIHQEDFTIELNDIEDVDKDSGMENDNLSPIPEIDTQRESFRKKSTDELESSTTKNLNKTNFNSNKTKSSGEQRKKSAVKDDRKTSHGSLRGNNNMDKGGESNKRSRRISSSSSSTQIEEDDEYKESKWDVVKQEIQEQRMKKISDDGVQAWDKVVGTLGQDNGSRQYLYRKYIDRPTDWRRGISGITAQQYDYIFHESDHIRKEYKWKNQKGKLPRLQERLREKERPKTTPNSRKRWDENGNEYIENGEEEFGELTTIVNRPTTAP